MYNLIFSILSIGASSVLWYYYEVSDTLVSKIVYSILAITFLILGLCCAFSFFYKRKLKEIDKLKEQIEVWSDTTYHINAAGDMAFQTLPIGIMIYDKNFNIKWFNDYAQKCLKMSLKDVNIEDINEKLKQFLLSEETSITILENDNYYEFSVKKENRILYFFDVTKEVELKAKYINRSLAVGIVVVDNLDESLRKYDVQDRTAISGKIFGEIANWASSYNCYFQTLDDNRVLIIGDREELNKMVDNKFDILDKVRNLSKSNRLKATASIGIASYDLKPNEVGNLALNAVELAEKRGGDQAVINVQGSKIRYFGAQVNAVEKNTLVAVRMQTNSLRDLSDIRDKILIMTHNKADCDAIGSVLAAYRLVENFWDEVKIALDFKHLDVTAKKAYQMLLNEEPELQDIFLEEDEALNYLTSNTLLLMCDTQSPSLAMFKSVIDKANYVAVIDHHRVGDVDFSNVEMSYVETYASSTVELITEMFMFTNVKVKPIEATIMLSGLIVDTNYFTYRTGYRTFEVASNLKELGADMVKVKMILRDSYEDEKIISEAVVRADIMFDRFAVTTIDEIVSDRTLLAKISDRLLTIEGVEASFTIARIGDDEVGISARSLDGVNVQIIMEEMGGGGHLQAAACQTKNTTVEEMKDVLVRILRRDYEILEGEKNMKVILLRDVKGKGKKDDIIDVPNGYGNFLINNKDAIIYNEENFKQLEENKRQEEEDRTARRNVLLKLKADIDNKTVTVYIKQGVDGKLFGHVTSKQIVEEFEAQNGILLDKRKLELPADINAIGIYQGQINLDKDIQATFQINVVGV